MKAECQTAFRNWVQEASIKPTEMDAPFHDGNQEMNDENC